MRDTHNTRLIKYLKNYGSITSIQSIQDLGNTRLSATIFQLRELGWKFKTEDIKVPTRWGSTTTVTKYSLIVSLPKDYDEVDVDIHRMINGDDRPDWS